VPTERPGRYRTRHHPNYPENIVRLLLAFAGIVLLAHAGGGKIMQAGQLERGRAMIERITREGW
jgi:hypothetical protein